MASMPELAPTDKNRFLGTTSLVTNILYQKDRIIYSTYGAGADILRLTDKPKKITVDGIELKESTGVDTVGYTWNVSDVGGVLRVKHSGKEVTILL
jgi:hypothetical protein